MVPGCVYCTRSQRVRCKTRVWGPRFFDDPNPQHQSTVLPRILNKGHTDYDELADLRLEGGWDEVLRMAMAWKGWTFDFRFHCFAWGSLKDPKNVATEERQRETTVNNSLDNLVTLSPQRSPGSISELLPLICEACESKL